MFSTWSTPMTDEIKLPRKLSEEPKAPKPRRPSHQKVIENLDRWANSPGLQPPKLPDTKNGMGRGSDRRARGLLLH
jgi:hypothetical protein